MSAFVRYLLAGLLAVAAAVALGYWMNRGSQVRLETQILKVRLIGTDDNSAVAVLDIRFRNPAKVQFVVRDVFVTYVAPDGKTFEGRTIAEVDLDRVLDYHKLAGPRYNPTLRVRDKLAAGEQIDRTLAADFPLAEAVLAGRRHFVIRVLDVDGAVSEFAEARQ
jgi:hypothetical protein